MPFVTGERATIERRSAPRLRVSVASWVTSLDGSWFVACTTRDVSPLGVCIHPREPQLLPKSLYYLDMKDRISYESSVRWQDRSAAGLQFVKAYKFSELPSPQVKQLIDKLSGSL
jgi:PilZ domain